MADARCNGHEHWLAYGQRLNSISAASAAISYTNGLQDHAATKIHSPLGF
jgi:hypothetical protein